eukprot:Gb_15869 [translate_table: standard]
MPLMLLSSTLSDLNRINGEPGHLISCRKYLVFCYKFASCNPFSESGHKDQLFGEYPFYIQSWVLYIFLYNERKCDSLPSMYFHSYFA